MKSTTSLLLALYCLFYTSCNKNKNTDTAYFSCYIDGQYWEPEKQQGLGEYPITAKLLYDETNLRLYASKGTKEISIWIFDTNLVKNNQYLLSKHEPNYSKAYFDNSVGADWFMTDSIFIGIANIIEIDKTNKIVQGTFYFDAYNSVKKDTVHITNGKFKLKYTLH